MPKLTYSSETGEAKIQQNIRAFGIQHIGDIENYEINREGGRITHAATFTGNGGFTVSWDEDTGANFNMNASAVTVNYRDDEDDDNYVIVTIGKLKETAERTEEP